MSAVQSTVGCVAPTTDPNKLLAALGSNVVEVDVSARKTGKIVAFVSADDNANGTRFNDGKATPQGVFIVGRQVLQVPLQLPLVCAGGVASKQDSLTSTGGSRSLRARASMGCAQP